MNKKLSSVVAALGLMASAIVPSACSETGLSLAPERPTLPSPEIELTSINARTCIAEIFRALASPEVLCPHPLEGEDIPEEEALEAQAGYDECAERVPETEATLSDEVIELFAPFLPADFNFNGPPAEVQSRIAEADIPLTVISTSDYDYGDNGTGSYGTSSFIVTPGFIEIGSLTLTEVHLFLRNNNIREMSLRSYKSESSTSSGRTYRNVSVHSSGSPLLQLGGGDSFWIANTNSWLNYYLEGSSQYIPFSADSSNLSIPIAIVASLGECIERDVRRINDGSDGVTILHLE